MSRISPNLAAVAFVCAIAMVPGALAEDFTFHQENVMGTSMELHVRADDLRAAQGAEGSVLREIDRLSKVFSGYDPSSEFRRWMDAPRGRIEVSAELFAMFEACDRWRVVSGGAFDARVEVLSRLWAKSARLGRLPLEGERAAARNLMAQPAWRLDAEGRTVERLADGPLTFNAIAKGYIVERAAEAAFGREKGVRGLLLNVGGDLRVRGDFLQGIGIADPSSDSESSEPMTVIVLRDRALATSGRSQRGYSIDGKWYSHIFDPRTGRSAQEVASASVIAPRSADADALATIFNVLSPEESLKLAGRFRDVECLIVTRDGRRFRTPGWARFERPMPLAFQAAADPKAQADTNSWGDEFELAVDFEINRPANAGGRYRRPYVAIWVEDKDGVPVRNLTLWVSQGGAGPFQWVPDLKRWFAADKLRKKSDKREMIFVIGRPTRPPGKYTAIWDGKDDMKKPVPPGEYTLYIDAAREHGTYQNMKQEIKVGGEPFVAEMKGGVEIKGATVEYRKKGKK